VIRYDPGKRKGDDDELACRGDRRKEKKQKVIACDLRKGGKMSVLQKKRLQEPN